ncbi:hypothetical protein VTL71DRAFT_8048 [Oculimacula yallundae]|uniref:Uncharacterized protein n=1 Tax=Oculimacula yallundae TaxID=86028 RepID=A0ABR4CWK9_9HELO
MPGVSTDWTPRLTIGAKTGYSYLLDYSINCSLSSLFVEFCAFQPICPYCSLTHAIFPILMLLLSCTPYSFPKITST